ncbi:hypothetical protein HELRODRAFT_64358 [Helobdella robusta]|uniref:DnaJ homolog subfamily C member 21 n=1 Tax=Helobdella robusta TaxID=6412 RepID=T1FXT4_HELRO|nr:hypothetical protein HELRODRAFT_64358 [Helobdella robusta]ESO06551.1 hypothetical protein HELRODRAFT_64358 [Helobdella robusta]
MKCHYEVLGLNLNASDEEIKKSYRRNALIWHPDKNPDSFEEAHKQFLLVQQAYDVLSDPQERTWYDKHRDEILKGGKGDQYEDKSLNVFQYFNASCYSGYDDDAKGFYSVYSEIFKQISEEDIDFVDHEPNMKLPPHFGSSTSPYDEVVGPFYSYWDSYSTAKTYVWVDHYDIRQAPNRQIRKAMEQENKKLRDKARKNRNEEIRVRLSSLSLELIVLLIFLSEIFNEKNLIYFRR